MARLAVFAGGCTLDAAEAVCGGDGIDRDVVFESLARLVAGSLVVAEDHGSQTRYRLLETIRQYGEERLGDAGEADTLRSRHAGHYAAFAEQAFGYLDGPEHVPWVARLSAEHDNLLAAWSWAIDADDVDTALRILCSVPRGHEGGYQLGLPGEAALTLSGATEHPEYPLVLTITAIDAASRGDLDVADRARFWALDADKRLHRAGGLGRREPRMPGARRRRDDHAARSPMPSRTTSRQPISHHADGKLAVASVNLAFAAWSCTIAGNETGAVPLAVEALALARQADMPYVLITALLVLGNALADTDPDQARACLDESLDRSAALGYENTNSLGLAFVLVSRLDDAPATLGIAGTTIRQLHWARQPVWLYASLNVIARALVTTRPDAAAIIQGAARADHPPYLRDARRLQREPHRVRARRRGPRAVSSWRCDAKPLGSSRPRSARNACANCVPKGKRWTTTARSPTPSTKSPRHSPTRPRNRGRRNPSAPCGRRKRGRYAGSRKGTESRRNARFDHSAASATWLDSP